MASTEHQTTTCIESIRAMVQDSLSTAPAAAFPAKEAPAPLPSSIAALMAGVASMKQNESSQAKANDESENVENERKNEAEGFPRQFRFNPSIAPQVNAMVPSSVADSQSNPPSSAEDSPKQQLPVKVETSPNQTLDPHDSPKSSTHSRSSPISSDSAINSGTSSMEQHNSLSALSRLQNFMPPNSSILEQCLVSSANPTTVPSGLVSILTQSTPKSEPTLVMDSEIKTEEVENAELVRENPVSDFDREESFSQSSLGGSATPVGEPDGSGSAPDSPSKAPAKRSSGSKKKTYPCRQGCQILFKTKEELWIHNRQHIKSEKALQCPQCPFITEYKHHLEYHMRNHRGEKPFQCPQCNYSCVNKSMLNSHMKSHSSVYQYQCADCTYATKYCHSLKLHLKKYGHKATSGMTSDGQSFDEMSPSQAMDEMKPDSHLDQLTMSSQAPFLVGPLGSLPNNLPTQAASQSFPGSLAPPLNPLNNLPLIYTSSTPNPAVPPPQFPFNLQKMSQDPKFPAAAAAAAAVEQATVGQNPPVLNGLPQAGAPPLSGLASIYSQLIINALNNQNLTNQNAAGNVATSAPALADTTQLNGAATLNEADTQGIVRLNIPPGLPGLANSALQQQAAQQQAQQRLLFPSSAAAAAAASAAAPIDLTSVRESPLSSSSSPWQANSGSANASSGGTASSDGSTTGGSSSRRKRKGPAFKLDSALRKRLLMESANIKDEEAQYSNGGITVVDGNVVVAKESTAQLNGHERMNGHSPASASGKWDDAYECVHCGIAFSDCTMYTLHMGFHGLSDPFTCNFCGKETGDKVQFFVHVIRDAHQQRKPEMS